MPDAKRRPAVFDTHEALDTTYMTPNFTPKVTKITLRGSMPSPAGKVLARSQMLRKTTAGRAKFFREGGRVVSDDLAPLIAPKPKKH
jgi:hypothetical protein